MEKNQIIAIAAVVILLAGGAGFFLLSNDDSDTLIVESSPDFPPFDYYAGGDFAGIDMDIVRAVCDDMGYKVKFRQNSFDSIILSVQQGKCDIGASGFSINEDRKKQVLFSEPYADIHQAVVAPIDSDIKAAADLDGVKISVQTGTTGADFAETLTSSGKVIFQKSYADVINDILNGKAACEVVDNTVAIAQVAAHPAELQVLDILADISPVEKYGFVFSKDNAALQEKFNASFDRIVENGLYDRIMKYYEDNKYSPDTPSYFQMNGTLHIDTSADFAPFEYLHKGDFAGIDMDIMRLIGEKTKYNVVFNNVNFDSLILSVQQHKCDMSASGFTIDEERKKQVLFSDPYEVIHQVLVVKKGTTIDVDNLSSYKYAVQNGTSGASCAEKYGGEVKVFSTYTEAVLDVSTGKSDCEVVDHTVAQAQVVRNSDLEVLDILNEAPEYYGFIFPKDNPELCAMVNAALAEIKADGSLDKIVNYYSSHEYADIPSYFDSEEYEDEDTDEPMGFWASLKDRIYTDFIKNDRYQYIFEGLKNTLIIAAVALVIGMILGALVAMVRSYHDQTGKMRILNSIGTLYTTVIRGTPVMVQLLLIYYVIFASSSLDSVMVASVAFGLNSGAYVAESVRAGINAVPRGQMEACRSLGMTNKLSMLTVILPQAIRNILPALGNEGISLLKETSVAGYIGIMDLTRGADIIRGQTYDALLPMLVAAGIYLAIVLVLTHLIKKMEKRLNNAYQ